MLYKVSHASSECANEKTDKRQRKTRPSAKNQLASANYKSIDIISSFKSVTPLKVENDTEGECWQINLWQAIFATVYPSIVEGREGEKKVPVKNIINIFVHYLLAFYVPTSQNYPFG